MNEVNAIRKQWSNVPFGWNTLVQKILLIVSSRSIFFAAHNEKNALLSTSLRLEMFFSILGPQAYLVSLLLQYIQHPLHIPACLISSVCSEQRVLNDLRRTRLFRRLMIWLLPHPLSCEQVVSLSQSSCVSPVELTDRRGGKDPNHTTARKPAPL
jgi:hypothetical protein